MLELAAQIEELRARARSGDHRAQYLLAAHLSQAGLRDEADRWLREAAKGSEPDALYTLATRELSTRTGAARSVGLLTKAQGSAAAVRLLAVLRAEGCGVERDWFQAVDAVLSLARSGHLAAQREIAGLLLLDDPEHAGAASLIDAAAAVDPIAAIIAVCRRALGRTWGDPNVAVRAQERVAAMRYSRAGLLAAKIPAASAGRPPGPPDWDAISDAIRRPMKATAISHALLSSPDVRLFESAFPLELLEYVIAQASPLLAPSTTFDSRSGAIRRDAYRTSLTATLGLVDQDLVIASMNSMIASYADVPPENGEFLSVLRYDPGNEYRPHFDWLPPGPDFDRGGQRVKTALLYLNDDYVGGETHFLASGIKVKGKPGDLLVFSNVGADGSGDKASRHAGLPVIRGTKWMGSKWLRERQYDF